MDLVPVIMFQQILKIYPGKLRTTNPIYFSFPDKV